MDGTSRKPWEEVENDEYSLSVMIFYFLFFPFSPQDVGWFSRCFLLNRSDYHILPPPSFRQLLHHDGWEGEKKGFVPMHINGDPW